MCHGIEIFCVNISLEEYQMPIASRAYQTSYCTSCFGFVAKLQNVVNDSVDSVGGIATNASTHKRMD